MDNRPYCKVAIDGPAGAGKSTIAKLVAGQLDFIYMDTGAMYRALALKSLRLGLNLKNTRGVATMLEHTDLAFLADKDGRQKMFMDDEDISDFIRTPEVTRRASDISALESVRLHMVAMQREMAQGKNIILDGRDIGSYVLPDAEVKIFLTASIEERARRRYKEMLERGGDKISVTYEQVKKDIEERDYNDSHRKLAPLVKAPDAVEVDTTGLEIAEVVEIVSGLIKDKCFADS